VGHLGPDDFKTALKLLAASSKISELFAGAGSAAFGLAD